MRSGALAESLLYLAAAAALFAGFDLPEPRVTPFVLLPRAGDEIRVVTWNVGRAGGPGEWGRALSDAHLEHVAAVLAELDPDLAFLQEVRVGVQAGRLRERLRGRGLDGGWEMEIGPSDSGRRVVALARRGELRRLDSGGDGSLAVLLERDDGVRLAAIGLHADVTSAARRNETIGAAADALAEHARAEGAAGSVLAGDLNIDLDLDKRRDLFTDDAYRDVETYNYVAGRLVDAARGTGSTAEPDRRLDYLFVDGIAFEVRAAGPLKDRRADDMDHDPVVADLVLLDR